MTRSFSSTAAIKTRHEPLRTATLKWSSIGIGKAIRTCTLAGYPTLGSYRRILAFAVEAVAGEAMDVFDPLSSSLCDRIWMVGIKATVPVAVAEARQSPQTRKLLPQRC